MYFLQLPPQLLQLLHLARQPRAQLQRALQVRLEHVVGKLLVLAHLGLQLRARQQRLGLLLPLLLWGVAPLHVRALLEGCWRACRWAPHALLVARVPPSARRVSVCGRGT
jgi:hypothetical protein